MGLDAIEIIMNCEDAFGISICDADAEKLRTAGDLHALIMRLLREPEGGTSCPSSRNFYVLRNKLLGIGMPRRMIRPQLRLAEIVQEVGEDRWPAVRKALEIPIDVRRPKWAEAVVFGGAILAGIAAGAWWNRGAWAGIAAALVAGYLLYLVTMPARIALERNQSLREVTYALLARQRRERMGVRKFSEAEVWQIIRGILSEQLGIPPEQIQKESRFMEDLGTG
jgi:acyl carrier protein